jgi:hypothetical protein
VALGIYLKPNVIFLKIKSVPSHDAAIFIVMILRSSKLWSEISSVECLETIILERI